MVKKSYNSAEHRQETRRKIREQVLAGLALCGVFSVAMWFNLTTEWLLLMATMSTGGLVLIFFARRGIWLSLWRGVIHLVGYTILGVTGLYGGARYLPEDARQFIYLSSTLIVVTVGVIYHIKNNMPYWRDTYNSNARYKIDLDKGLIDMTMSWARRRGQMHVGTGGAAVVWAMPFILLGVSLSKMVSTWGMGGNLFPIILGIFMWSLGVGFSLSEFYYAYKIFQMEKQIGRPLIMKGFEQ